MLTLSQELIVQGVGLVVADSEPGIKGPRGRTVVNPGPGINDPRGVNVCCSPGAGN